MKSYKQVKKELLKHLLVYDKRRLSAEEVIRFRLARQCIEQRYSLQMTQAQLARELHTTQAVVSRFESGKANSTIKFLLQVATYFGFDLLVQFTARPGKRPNKNL